MTVWRRGWEREVCGREMIERERERDDGRRRRRRRREEMRGSGRQGRR